MRRRDFIRLLGGAAVDVCIDCVQFLASGGRTGLEHQPEWSLAAIAAQGGPEWGLGESRRRRSLWLLVAVRNVRQREVWSSLSVRRVARQPHHRLRCGNYRWVDGKLVRVDCASPPAATAVLGGCQVPLR